MSDYEKYVTEINNIYSKLEKLKNSWTNNDSLNFIDEINKYKNSIINAASFLQEQTKNKSTKSEEML